MSVTLIAVVLALFLGHVITGLTRLRRYGWFDHWLAFGENRLDGLFGSRFSLLLSLGLPLLLVAILQAWLQGRYFGVPAFLFALLALLYSWGPRDLDRDVEAIEEAPDEEARERALAQLADRRGAPHATDEAELVGALFAAARRRWFGVLLWFLLLGPFGALMYRLTAPAAARSGEAELPGPHMAAYRHLLAILDWPVAHLMALALALVGSFDAVHQAWRDWHQARRGESFDFSHGFLMSAALASVRLHCQHQQVENALDQAAGLEPGEPELPLDAPRALAALHAAMTLCWRILVAWLVVLALFVLAGYV